MEALVPATLRRAAARGQTVENGGVIIWDNTAEAKKYSEAERNSLRSVGFEKLVIAKGEKMLLIQKFGIRKGQPDPDKESRTAPTTSLRRRRRRKTRACGLPTSRSPRATWQSRWSTSRRSSGSR